MRRQGEEEDGGEIPCLAPNMEVSGGGNFQDSEDLLYICDHVYTYIYIHIHVIYRSIK
jgi:hypothetical protein